jgi:predicted amidophosphoribosyltransferase
LKFLYKIHAGFDGFSPSRIPQRAIDGRLLELGWNRYLDEVEFDDEVWVYFHGRNSFMPGVYVKGVIAKIDSAKHLAYLLIQDYSTTKPLTRAATSRRIGEIVSIRYRQVFFVPNEWKTAPNCSLTTTARSCARRRCRDCLTWKALPQVDSNILRRPWRMDMKIAAYCPAFWVIPPRSFLYYDGRPISPGVIHTSGLFRRFKVGDKNLAYPFALALVQQLRRAGMDDFDAVVPIPLSPDKAARGELHRTRALSEEVSRLLRVPVVELLSLEKPISKRALRSATGAGPEEFEAAYRQELRVSERAVNYTRILLVDDVCTDGSTLECGAEAILAVNPAAEVCTGTAGQMAVRPVVLDDTVLYAKG